jgi:flagellar basal-body rod protein FlgF
MDNALYYLAVNRQIGLRAEMQTVANNIANLATTGYRREGLAFTEHVVAVAGGESVSMADLGARFTSGLAGEVTITGGRLDLAIEGAGYFLLQAGDETVLSRAGAFQLAGDGFVTTPSGDRLLDAGGAPIAIPPGTTEILVGADGTVSADGDPVGQIAVADAPPERMVRHGNTAFRVEGAAYEIVEAARIRQGALERSNVDAIGEVARMIEVSRAYEMAQSVIADEDERVRDAIRKLGTQI